MLIVQQSALFSKTDLHILNYKNREKHLAYYKSIKNIFQLRWIKFRNIFAPKSVNKKPTDIKNIVMAAKTDYIIGK